MRRGAWVGSPDGVALVNTATMKVIDALSYEGAIAMAMVTGVGTASLAEGMALPGAVADSNTENASLSRLPTGHDGNNAATDWACTKSVTPGLPDLP